MSNTFVLLLAAVVVLPVIGGIFTTRSDFPPAGTSLRSVRFILLRSVRNPLLSRPEKILDFPRRLQPFRLVSTRARLLDPPSRMAGQPVRPESGFFTRRSSATALTSPARSAKRARLLDVNPILWLAESDGTSAGRALSRRAWAVPLLARSWFWSVRS